LFNRTGYHTRYDVFAEHGNPIAWPLEELKLFGRQSLDCKTFW